MKKIAALTTILALIGCTSSAFADTTWFSEANAASIPIGTEDFCESVMMHPQLDRSLFECQKIGRGNVPQFKRAGFLIQNVSSHTEQTPMQGPTEVITFNIKKVQ